MRYFFADGQAESCAGFPFSSRFARAVKALKDFFTVFRFDPYARILNRNLNSRRVVFVRGSGRDFELAAPRGELDGVVNEVAHKLRNPRYITLYLWQALLELAIERDLLAGSQNAQPLK